MVVDLLKNIALGSFHLRYLLKKCSNISPSPTSHHHSLSLSTRNQITAAHVCRLRRDPPDPNPRLRVPLASAANN